MVMFNKVIERDGDNASASAMIDSRERVPSIEFGSPFQRKIIVSSVKSGRRIYSTARVA
jgi:hypothetical protein